MKFQSAILAISMTSSALAGENGLRRSLEEAPTPYFPAGFNIVPLPTDPVEECVSALPTPYVDVEYIVLQYGDSLNSTCLDIDDELTQDKIELAFLAAYDEASSCEQAGAFCGVNGAKLVAQSGDTFLLRTISVCNAGTFLGDDETCGIDLLGGDIPVVGLDRRLEEMEMTCSCPPPSAADVLSKFNEIIYRDVSVCPDVVTAWGTAIEQYCPLECAGEEEYTYSSEGVVPPCETSEFPSEYPSEYPTESQEPTEEDSEAPTEEDSASPSAAPVPDSASPSASPTEPTTDAPSASPTEPTTDASVEPTTDAPVEPTDASVEPTTDAPVEPTDAPVEPTDAPVEPTDAPVEPTDAPVEPTDAPVEPTTDAPTPTLT